MEPNRRTLVVDDSRVIRTIVSRALTELGFQPEEAGNGREALERLKQGLLPVVVMIDWNMPELNGLEMVQAVRANPDWEDVRLVMITSENELDRVQTALMAGADEYIMKPFTKEMIQEKLNLLGVPIPAAAAPAA
ncbi:MAG: response regulator [Methylacidiphilales bacterium]|nr:response regulator [Candidatus Methylacidiphilales bacterium]